MDAHRVVPFTIGDPGRLPYEVRSGVPLGHAAGPDIELSEHQVGGVAIRAASLRGLMHRHQNNDRQDAYSVTWNDEQNTLLVAVADGVGEHPCSREASEMAVAYASANWSGLPTSLIGLGSAVNDHLIEHGPKDTDGYRTGSTTLILVALCLGGGSQIRADLVWVGDSPAWYLKDSKWTNLTSLNSDDPSFAAPIKALPSQSPTFHTATHRLEGGAVFVMTDGVGNTLRATEVRTTLAEWWQTAPEVFTFGSQVNFGRRSFMDDRTCVGAWLPEPDISEAALASVEGVDPGLARIPLDSLDIGAKLGVGGHSYVNRLDGRPVPGDPREMVIKRVLSTVDPKHVGPVLQGMRDAVAFRDRLAPADRQYLDTITVWPVAMVTDKGADIGCVMPLIPPDFFETLPTGKEPRVIGALMRDAQARVTVGSTEPGFDDDILRLVILAKLAGAIEFLHSHDIVFGDLNPRNEVFRFNPPTVLLLDCETTAHITDPTRADRQGHFPFWAPPETLSNSKIRQGFETDVFKLALAFAKTLSPGPGSSQRRTLPSLFPDAVTPELAAVLQAALDPNPDKRPSAADIRIVAERAAESGGFSVVDESF